MGTSPRELHWEIARFRSSTLREHKQKIANYDQLRLIIENLRTTLETEMTLLRMFPEVYRIEESRIDLDNLRLGVPESSLYCSVLSLRVSDIFSLMTPQLVGAVRIAEKIERGERDDILSFSDEMVERESDTLSLVSSDGRKLFGEQFGKEVAG